MKDLLLEYKKTKEITIEKINKIKESISILEKEFKVANKKKKEHIKKQIQQLEYDKKLYSSCKSDLDYTISWIEKGRAPGSKRGIERRAAYERERSFDPLLMQRYFRSNQPEYPWEMSDYLGYDKPVESLVDQDEKELIEFALQGLTANEREMYMLFAGKSLSQYKIADMLYVTRNTVKTTLARAKRKIQSNVKKYKQENEV